MEKTQAAEVRPQTDGRKLTFGEEAVGLTFNPGGNPAVDSMKRKYASIIDDLNDLRTQSESPGVKRHCATGITDAETAQMRAVKAITWQH